MESINNFNFNDIEQLRDNLLDMSLRNNLLNFKPRKKSIEIVDEDIVSLYNLIVLKETKMKFYSNENFEKEIEPEPEYNKHNLDGYLKINPINTNDNTWDSNAEIKESHLDKFLQTDYTKDELRKKLNYLYRENKTNLEEQGYNNLFLALGFLEWKEDDNSKVFHSAPLILVPMTIVKEKVSSPYTVYWTGDEVRSNLSLIYKLKDQNIDLEEFDELESENDLINYLKRIEKAIKIKKGWRITKDIFLSNFSFKKFVMFKDLDSRNWNNIGSSCVNGLYGQNTNTVDSEHETEYDFDSISSKEIYNVLDADSSQLAVLEDIKNGKNLVVEGPPGTGKSQTIVNIIAELMAMNKKILFVSEKKAALDVVKSRLDYLGLGDGCLELHGKNSNKKEVLKELQDTLELEHIQLKDKRNFQELDYLKRELNEYSNTLHSIYANTGLTAFTLIGFYIKNKEILEKNNQLIFDIHLNDVSSFDAETRGNYIKKLDEIKSYYDLVKPISENAWRDTYPYDISTMDVKEIETNLNDLINNFNDFEEISKKIHDITGIDEIDSLNIENKINKLNILNSNSKLIESTDNPDELINDIEIFQKRTENIDLDVFSLNLDEINNETNELFNNISSSNIDVTIIDNEDLEYLKEELKIKNEFIENSNLKDALSNFELEQKLNDFKAKKEFIENSNLKETLDDENLTTKLNEFKTKKEFIENSNLNTALSDPELELKLDQFKTKKEFIENSNIKEILDDENLTTKLNEFKTKKEFIENSNLKETLSDSELEQKLNDFKTKKEFIENSNLRETLSDSELEQKLNDFKAKKEFIENSNLKETLDDENLTTKLNEFKTKKEFIENSNLNNTLTDPELELKLDQFKNKKDSLFKRTFNSDYKKIKKEFNSYYSVAVDDNKIIKDLEELIKTNDEYQVLKKGFNKYYSIEVSDEKIINDLEELIKINIPYKKLKKDFNSYYSITVADDKIIDDLEELIIINKEFNVIYNEFKEYYSTDVSSDKIILELNELIETNDKFNSIKKEFDSYYNISAQDNQIINDLEELIKTNIDYKKLKQEFNSYYSVAVPYDKIINDLEELIKTNEEYQILKNKFSTYYGAEIDDYKIIGDLEELIKTNEEFAILKNNFNEYYTTDVSNQQLIEDLDKLIQVNNELELIKNKLLAYSKDLNLSVNELIIESDDLFSYYNQLNNICLDFEKYNILITPKSIKEEMIELLKLRELLNKIVDREHMGSYYFKPGWDSHKSDTGFLRDILTNLNKFNEHYHEGFFNAHTVELAQTIDYDKLNELILQLTLTKQQIISIFNKLNNKLYLNRELNCFEKLTENSPDNAITSISEYKKYMVDFLSHIDDLNNYRLFVKYCEEYKDENTKSLIDLIQKDNINSDLFINTFYYNFARTALREIFSEDNILDDFNYSIHQEKIEKFKQLDKEIMNSNIIRVKEKLSDNRPNILTLVSADSSLGILKHEFTKKRRIMPIRRLLSRTFDAVSSIKPCFMMSPISIAQFLEPRTFESYFDYVIFDEASQVKIEDSIGAFLRAKKYVVMGDTKQLPPTSFFEKELDIDEIDEDNYTTDIESILHLCKNTTETKMLKWHYRSRHESLINVSNNEFYDNKLYVFPSPMICDDDLGLKFEYDPSTEYQRGYGANNIKEAENLVEYLFNLVGKYGNTRSIGVGTFNIKQRNTILDILENKLKEHPELEKYIDESGKEGFFVKNLENIQGDERDIILISMGYGKDANGKLTMNFGPLNKDGGERRLNVLITRARMQCVVFSNFKSSEMITNDKTPRGVEALKTFLYYAELGELPENYHTGEDFDSPFEESVYDFLVDEGYSVEKQVGCAGYKIDLAIIDKEDSNRYILAVECDGATYHSSKSARDRDRLRQSVLEDLGWKFYRIWSTDWFHQTASAKERLINAIETAIKQKDSEDTARLVESSFEPEVIVKTNEELIAEESNNYFEDYKYCPDLNMYGHSYEAVLKALIEFEGPIHIDDIYDTVKKIGNQRANKQFKRNIKFCLARVDSVYEYNDFYYDRSFNIKTMKVRKRIKPNISRISDEELATAIVNTLKTEFSSSKSNLIKSASMHLGFKSTGSKIKEKFNYIIDYMLRENVIKEKNGIIELSLE